MAIPGDRLDAIIRPNLSQIALDWKAVVPDDHPPAIDGEEGNTGEGCIGLYCGMSGYVRAITRAHERSMMSGERHPADWLSSVGNRVFWQGAGMQHEVQWLTALPRSVRIYVEGGSYLWGLWTHCLAHDTTVPLGHIWSLRT